jgi:uncharacterized protein YdiU (UPF0061 family)
MYGSSDNAKLKQLRHQLQEAEADMNKFKSDLASTKSNNHSEAQRKRQELARELDTVKQRLERDYGVYLDKLRRDEEELAENITAAERKVDTYKKQLENEERIAERNHQEELKKQEEEAERKAADLVDDEGRRKRGTWY